MAIKKRVNITIDAETLRLADRAARRQRTSRSEFIRNAVRAQAQGERQAGDEALLDRRRRAIEGMNRLARQFGDWPAEQILRAARNRWQKPKA